jgi:hypothetical protein
MFKLVLFILIVLILGLIFYSFLANTPYLNENFTNQDEIYYNNDEIYQPPYNSYNNYNHFTGSSCQLTPGTYYEKNGNVIRVSPTANGNINLQEQNPNNETTNVYTPSSNPSATTTTYYGNNGATASIVNLNGDQVIVVKTPAGNTYIYSQNLPMISSSNSTSTNNITSTQYYGSTGSTVPEADYSLAYTKSTVFTGPNGAVAIINSNNTITLTENGTTINFTSVNNSTTSFTSTTGATINVITQGNRVILKLIEPNGTTEIFYKNMSNGNSASYTVGDTGSFQSNSNLYSQFPYNTSSSTTTESYSNMNSSTNPYNSVYPQGVSKSQIPPGEENLYILKSEIVPPVCPACPPTTICPNKNEKPPPCPPCERCPEPDYSCKLVPNYTALDYQSNYYGSGSSCNNKQYSSGKTLPVPVNNYSTYGM